MQIYDTYISATMRAFVAILAFAALAHSEDDIDWSTVKSRDITIPGYGDIDMSHPGKIVGGTEAKPNSIPYQVGLLLTASDGTYFCGGSLISPRYVLTAAHCLDAVTKVEVRLGAHQINTIEDTQLRLFTAKFTQHPEWNSLKLQNDIAVIELPQSVPINEHIQLVALPKYSDVNHSFYGTSARISGWGKDSDSATAVSPILREVFADVITNFICKIRFLGVIKKTHICTSGRKGRGACSGDSGGPLVVGNMQIGIVSFGLAVACEIGWPSAFTRVTSYLDWIANNTDVTISHDI